MTTALYIFAFLALLLCGAIFGFFYAWVCSTMWGLDAADPRVAIAAMQAMNASVRNAVFAPAFFATPVVLLVAAGLAHGQGAATAAVSFAAAGLVYLGGGLALTLLVNVPMNEALAAMAVPDSAAEAERVWRDFSGRWQIWNLVRTGFSGLALALTGLAILTLRGTPAAP